MTTRSRIQHIADDASKITTDDDGWTSQYNSHDIMVGRVHLHVEWGLEGHYEFSFSLPTCRLKSHDGRKKDVVLVAERVLREALAEIEALKLKMGIK